MKRIFAALAGFQLAVFFYPTQAMAHVKWFSAFSFQDKPSTLSEVLQPLFWMLMVLSMVVIGLFVVLDKKLATLPKVQSFAVQLNEYKKYSLSLMRAASAAVLLLSFQADALFVPELKVSGAAIGWIQFVLAVLLMFTRAVPLVGGGILGLYLFGVVHFGWFHMLDYIIFAGVGYYLLVSLFTSEKVKESGLVALYLTAGMSLCWVAIEKLLYPQWGLYILEQNPQLSLGFDFKFFLTSAAFVEFGLGYLMIICLLQRPLAVVVTLVFFSTTLVFGKMEVIGHTIIHAALIVFIIEGSGRFYKAPINFHDRLRLKIPFGMINFAILFFVMMFPYQKIAMAKHLSFVEQRNQMAVVDVTGQVNAPEVTLEIIEEMGMGWNVHVKTKNFTFAPQNAGQAHRPGEGHGHLYVGDKKAGRVYGDWYYLSDLPEGKHEVKLTLNSNDHKLYMNNGKPVEDTVWIEVENIHAGMDH